MLYKHHLTEQQYMTIWTIWIDQLESNYSSAYKGDILNRKLLWRQHFKNKFKLTYTEPSLINDDGEPSITDEMRNQEDFWGTVSGSNKAITWFLLQL